MLLMLESNKITFLLIDLYYKFFRYVDPAKVLNKFYRQRKHSYMVDID